MPDACTLPNRQSEIVSLMDDVDADSVLVVFYEKEKKKTASSAHFGCRFVERIPGTCNAQTMNCVVVITVGMLRRSD